jgi:hypothetical protein
MEPPGYLRPDIELIDIKRVFSHHELKMVVYRRTQKNPGTGRFEPSDLKHDRHELHAKDETDDRKIKPCLDKNK